jgi:hypothetical protein
MLCRGRRNNGRSSISLPSPLLRIAVIAGIASAPPTLLALTPCAHLTSSHSPPGFFTIAWPLEAPSSIAAVHAARLTVCGRGLGVALCRGLDIGMYFVRAMRSSVFTLG